jgi:hypothetical protein
VQRRKPGWKKRRSAESQERRSIGGLLRRIDASQPNAEPGIAGVSAARRARMVARASHYRSVTALTPISQPSQR